MIYTYLSGIVLLIGILIIVSRAITLIIGIENSYKAQEADLKKVDKRTLKSKIIRNAFKSRALMTLITLGHSIGVVVVTLGLTNVIFGGIMKTKIGKIILTIIGMMALAFFAIVSIYDLMEAYSNRIKSKTHKNSKKQIQNKRYITVDMKKYDEKRDTGRLSRQIPIPKAMQIEKDDPLIQDRPEDMPKATVNTVGDTDVISTEDTSFTSTVSRQPFFKKNDAAERFINGVKKAYSGEDTQGELAT